MYGEQKNSNLWATVFLRLLVTIILITVVADVGRSDDSTGTPVFATQLDVTYLWQVLVVLAILSMVIWNRKLFKEIKFRKRIEEELLKSEAKHRLLFDNANDAIFIHNMQARILAANPMACERFGYTNTDMMSMTVNQVDSPEEAEHVHERIAMLMKNGHLTFDTVHHGKDGSPIPTEVSARRITWDGQPAVMSFCRDITKRKVTPSTAIMAHGFLPRHRPCMISPATS
jgi:PAS domain S-box-containing protein